MAPRKKATAAPAEVKEVKEEVKAEAAAVVEEAVPAPAKKTPAKKPAAKKTAPKAEVKPETKAEVIIEFGGVQVPVEEIVKNAKLTVGEDKDVKIYVKPEESKAYIVAGEEAVAMDVFFC